MQSDMRDNAPQITVDQTYMVGEVFLFAHRLTAVVAMREPLFFMHSF
jgi:hypothetical protein